MPLDRNSSRIPRLGEDWKNDPLNMDPRTGRPYKRRAARYNLGALAGRSQPTTNTGTAPSPGLGGVPGQGAQYDPSGSATGGVRRPTGQGSLSTTPTTGGGAIPRMGPGGATSSPVDPTGLPGELGEIDISKLGDVAGSDVAIYGQLMPGGSGSAAANEYARLFPVGSMGAALGGGNDLNSNTAYLQAGHDLFAAFGGGAGQGKFLNPVDMMQNIFDYAMNITSQVEGGNTAGGPLAAIAQMEPIPALNAFLDVVQGALTSTMPEDIANAYVAMLQRIGTDMIDQWYKDPLEANNGGSDVIQQLFARLGPGMGLGAGTSGNNWQGSQAQANLR